MTQKKVLIIGEDTLGKSDLLMATLKEKYGDDVIVVTPEQAKEQGLKMDDFDNIPTMKFKTPIPLAPYNKQASPKKSGKQNRRQRRAEERKLKKKNL